MNRRWLAILVWCTSCAHGASGPRQLAVAGSELTLEAAAGTDPSQLPSLAEVVREALPQLAEWGGLQVATRLVVLPDHAALERQVERPGYGWLRAWARYDVIYLQAPNSWGPFGLGPSHPELRDLLVHELTHCAMYQAVSDGSDWAYKRIPLWFREGLASWTAQETGRRLSRAGLAESLQRHPAIDPLGQGDTLFQRDEPLVYSAAHWGFGLLLSEGPDRVRRLLTLMRAGLVFPAAFTEVYGEPQQAFEERLLRALRANTALAAQ